MEAVAPVDSMRPNTKDENGKRPRYYVGIDVREEAVPADTSNNVAAADKCVLRTPVDANADTDAVSTLTIAV